MSDTISRSGRCLCGAVTLSAERISKQVGACHCDMCRRWGGGPLMSVDCGDAVQWRGQTHIGVYASSDWAERGFCSQCGSHLFYRLKESGQYIVPVGLFADEPDFVFDHQVFIDEKPHYYQFANKTQDMTGAEIFAKYGATQD
ncbi:MAG: GFA family protein [Pseudomonadota bacterium]|nr:GFA family protein [Pseudomonadota bacterium]